MLNALLLLFFIFSFFPQSCSNYHVVCFFLIQVLLVVVRVFSGQLFLIVMPSDVQLVAYLTNAQISYNLHHVRTKEISMSFTTAVDLAILPPNDITNLKP